MATQAIDVLKGVIKHGTVEASSKKFLGDRPAAGKTGTYEDNTNATFVGFTAQLSAAVWMGNPLASGTDEMRNIPEFNAVGVPMVHGGNLPYRIWDEFIGKASDAKAYPPDDWPAPAKLPRGSKRLYLPGNECVYTVTGTAPGAPDPSATNPDGTPGTAHAATVTDLRQGRTGTTIPPDQLDPTAPVGAYAPAGALVGSCAGPPAPPPSPDHHGRQVDTTGGRRSRGTPARPHDRTQGDRTQGDRMSSR